MINKEYACYPILKKWCLDMGYFYRRVEGPNGHPDAEIAKADIFNYVEVKIYRGERGLNEVLACDLKWQPGQKKFYMDLLKTGSGDFWRCAVFNREGEFLFKTGEQLFKC